MDAHTFISFSHKNNKVRKGDMIRSKTVKGMNAFTTVTPLSGVSSLKSRQTNTETVLVLSARGFRQLLLAYIGGDVDAEKDILTFRTKARSK